VLKHHIDAALARQASHLFGPIPARVVDHFISAKLARLLKLLVRAGRRNHARSAQACDLYPD
jgi:hypothetical protein